MDNNLIKSILHLKDASAYRLDEGIDEYKKRAKAAGHKEGSKEYYDYIAKASGKSAEEVAKLLARSEHKDDYKNISKATKAQAAANEKHKQAKKNKKEADQLEQEYDYGNELTKRKDDDVGPDGENHYNAETDANHKHAKDYARQMDAERAKASTEYRKAAKERKGLEDDLDAKIEAESKKNELKMKHSKSEKEGDKPEDEETPETENDTSDDTDNEDNDPPATIGGEDIPEDEDEGNGGEPTGGEGNGNATPEQAQAAADKIQVMDIEKTITKMMNIIGDGKEVDPETFINNYDSIMNILAGLFKYETKGEAVKSDGTGSTPTTADEDKAKEKAKPANGDANKDNSNGGE